MSKTKEKLKEEHSTEKNIEKYDRVEVTADGKMERAPGSERLDKLKKKWKKLKKAVDSNVSIMDIAGQEYDEDEDTGEEESGADMGDVQPGSNDELEEQEDDQAGSDNDVLEEDEEDEEDEELTDEDYEKEGQLIELLQQEGYSEAEIAHIVHGHSVPTPTLDEAKVDSEQAKAQHDLEHKKRISNVEHQAALENMQTNHLDRDHKKRILDLEFEYAKKEKDLELEFKRKELEQKIENMKNKAKQTEKKSVSIPDPNRDAKVTSQDEKEGK